jgi:hypothetical protein
VASANPLDELRSVSQIPSLDLAALKRGQIAVVQGQMGDFQRGIFVESCYFIAAPMELVGNGLLHWNPVQHNSADVRAYREFGLRASPETFRDLRLDPNRADDKWLITQTTRVAQGSDSGNELHLTTDEIAFLRQKPLSPSEFWQEILLRRSTALATGGLVAVAPYGREKSISPASEFRGLLSLAPRVAQHFRTSTEAHPLNVKGKVASEVVGYWEAEKVHNHTTLELGIIAVHKFPDSWQLIDCVYYTSDTYFMALDLFQLWPVEGGTLIWQVSFVSAPFRTYLGGVDRYIAIKQMVNETRDTIKAFQADLQRRR